MFKIYSEFHGTSVVLTPGAFNPFYLTGTFPAGSQIIHAVSAETGEVWESSALTIATILFPIYYSEKAIREYTGTSDEVWEMKRELFREDLREAQREELEVYGEFGPPPELFWYKR